MTGRLFLINPQSVDVSLGLDYPITCDIYMESELLVIQGTGAEGESLRVTVPARGSYELMRVAFQATTPGTYTVDWGGMRREVIVDVGEVIPRIVTDKTVYRQYEGGYATFAYYNPSAYTVSFMPPSHVTFNIEYNGVRSEIGQAIFFSWISSNFTIPPHDSFKIYRFVFTTGETGDLTLVINGIRKTVQVLPLEP